LEWVSSDIDPRYLLLHIFFSSHKMMISRLKIPCMLS
jgi:hypothetical protein